MSMTISPAIGITGLPVGGLPDASVTQSELADGVAAKGVPAFSAYQSTLQSIPNASFTKVQFQTEDFDLGGFFDSTTNYRFQPTVAGYYQISSSVGLVGAATNSLVAIYKNGTEYSRGTQSGSGSVFGNSVSSLIYMNGSSDYLEIFCYQSSGGALNTANSRATCFFQGILIAKA